MPRFIKEDLDFRLKQQLVKGGQVTLPTFSSVVGFDFSPTQLKDLARESEAQYDLDQLSLSVE